MKREYPSHPIAAVGVVVFKGDKILLVRRAKPPKSSEWSIPGGAQELGETLLKAAKREVKEDTSISIENVTLLDVVDFIKTDENGDAQYHYSLIDYRADYRSGDLIAGDDAIDTKWVSIETLDEYNLWSETKQLIEKAVLEREN